MIALINTLFFALNFLWWAIVLSAIFSWLHAFNVINTRNDFVVMIGRTLAAITEPLFRPIRRLLPDTGGVDLSPVVILILIYFFQNLLISLV